MRFRNDCHDRERICSRLSTSMPYSECRSAEIKSQWARISDHVSPCPVRSWTTRSGTSYHS